MPYAWEKSTVLFLDAVHEICCRMGPGEGLQHLERLSEREKDLSEALFDLEEAGREQRSEQKG